MKPTLRLKPPKGSFLRQYRVERKYLVRPDRAKGQPGIKSGTGPSGVPVLVKIWPRDPSKDDADLRDIWRNEIRQLHRLAAHPGAAEYICDLSNSGEDEEGFYLVLNASQRIPLQTFLSASRVAGWIAFPASYGDRIVVWQNVRRLALGLQILHSQGLLHRNLSHWAVLTAGRDEADFQLTGFEWSIRLSAHDSAAAGRRHPLRDASQDSFLRDWHQFALIACDLLQVDHRKARDRSIAHHEVSEGAIAEEILLIRELMQVVPNPRIDGEYAVERMDRIIAALGVRASRSEPRLVLVLNLGPGSSLSTAVRQASGKTIELDDVEGQLTFIRDDLAITPLAMSIKVANQPDRLKLLLRGQHLTYHVDDFLRRGRTPSNWESASCEKADVSAPIASHILKQARVSGSDFEFLTLQDAFRRHQRKQGRTSLWHSIRENLKTASAGEAPAQRLHKALWLTQVIDYLFAASEAFPVSVVGTERDTDGVKVLLRARYDAEREALSTALNLRDKPGKRLAKALLGGEIAEESLWLLTDGPRLGDRSSSDIEWRFVGEKNASDGQPAYCFAGDKTLPVMQDTYVIASSAVGRDSQLRRRLKCLAALAQHTEAMQMIADPRQRVLRSEEAIEEDSDFRALDGSKQTALRAITETVPLYLVQGPPGVGKTRLVTDLVKRRFRGDPSTRLLLTAQSNYAVDHLLEEVEKIFHGSDAQPLMIRCHPKDKQEQTSSFDLRRQAADILSKLVNSDLVKGSSENLKRRIASLNEGYTSGGTPRQGATAPEYAQQAFEGLVLRSANVVFATTNSAELERLLDEKGQFDWSIVEEAGKATGGELIAPLLLSHRRLMIGDHKQLPPFGSEQVVRLLETPATVRQAVNVGDRMIGRTFRSAALEELMVGFDSASNDVWLADMCREARRAFFLFETLIEDEFERAKRAPNARAIASKLTAQHRMHPQIATLVSDAFYGGDLTTDNERAAEFATGPSPIRSIDRVRLPEAPVVWVDMPWVQSTKGKREGDSFPTWHNAEEVLAVQHVLGLMRVREDTTASLAVLSPYSQQVKRLERAIAQHWDGQLQHLKAFRQSAKNGRLCHTVDSFQGSEADAVIVSLVRNNPHGAVSTALGFLSDARRMNVLLSRARWKLVVIGSLEFLNAVRRLPMGADDSQRIQFLDNLLNGLSTADNVSVVPFDKLRGAA